MVVGSTEDGKIVLIKQHRIPVGDYIIEFPAGLIDEGETAEEAAIREFKEETGMEITKIAKVSPPTYNSAGLTDETVTMVFAEVKGKPSTELNEDAEDIEALVLDSVQLHELVQDQKIKWSAKAWMYCGIYVFFNS